ncbi:MAG: hypothetical protein AB3N23_00840, partial [Paracoccaceae bacterium]
MFQKALTAVRHRLPDELAFHYYPDRQSAWLMAQLWHEDRAKVGALRQTRVGKLLDRPLLKPLVARCGGTLRRHDVMALAHADQFGAFDDLTHAGEAVLEACWSETWLDFGLTFTQWGAGKDWQYAQISREGGSLVIQLGFPTDHAQLMGRYLPVDAREKFEEDYHPIRTEGRPTLAWARVDMDLERGEALIEEVQCDWLRLVKDEVDWLAQSEPQSRDTRAHQSYQRALFARYAKIWPQAMMLSTLAVLVEQLGMRRIWMHQPTTGAALKGIGGGLPPVSALFQKPKKLFFLVGRRIPRPSAPPPPAPPPPVSPR